MHIRDLSGKNVCILGFGKEGQATLKAIEDYTTDAHVTIADSNLELGEHHPHLQTTNYQLQTGPTYLQQLERFDVIIKTPGIPPQPELEAVQDKISSGTQIFLDSVVGTGALTIGITGSKGKSTTSTMIYELLNAAGKDVYLIGNIGTPSIAHIGHAKPGTVFVLEMSSYQLMDLTTSPQIAVVTAFFPEHLDYHGSLKAYKEAKKHIVKFQSREDTVFYCSESAGAAEIAAASPGQRIAFSADDSPVRIEETHLLGHHNQSNISGAYKVAEHLGIPKEICLDVFRAFRGLPHRLQSLGIHHGVEWVDDAISTTPESTIAALDALGDRVATIILGGQDRGYRFADLAKRLLQSNIRTVILFPGSGPRIKRSLKNALKTAENAPNISLHDVSDMQTAVQTAKTLTPQGSICLLSTASPSYGMFKNFEEKGEVFKKNILEKAAL